MFNGSGPDSWIPDYEPATLQDPSKTAPDSPRWASFLPALRSGTKKLRGDRANCSRRTFPRNDALFGSQNAFPEMAKKNLPLARRLTSANSQGRSTRDEKAELPLLKLQ